MIPTHKSASGQENLSEQAKSLTEKSTADPSAISIQTTSEDSHSAIFSAEYSDGPSLFDWRESLTMKKHGAEAVPASHSATPERDAEPTTSATSGLPSFDSSPPAIHESSMASKSPARQSSDRLQSRLNESLARRLSRFGSMEYALTSNLHTTPAQRQIYRLRASALPTGDNGCIGWPTPNTPSGGPNSKSTATHTGGMDLEGAATLAPWPTPMAGTPAQNGNNEAGNNDYTRKVVALTQLEIGRAHV